MAQGGFCCCSFVTRPVERQPEKLGGSEKFDTDDYFSVIAQKFDEGLKRVFSDDTKKQFVKFGMPTDKDPDHGIKGGKFVLTG